MHLFIWQAPVQYWHTLNALHRLLAMEGLLRKYCIEYSVYNKDRIHTEYVLKDTVTDSMTVVPTGDSPQMSEKRKHSTMATMVDLYTIMN